MSHNNHDKTIKNIGAIFLSVLVFALVYNVLLGGNGFGVHMAYGRTSYGLGGSLSLILALAIKLLFLVIIVAVVAGIVAAIKNQGLDNIDLSFIDKLFDNGHHRRHLCPHCHREIEHDWKNCPYCGSSTKKESKKSMHETQKSVTRETEVHSAETSITEIPAKEDSVGEVTNLKSNIDATPAENADRKVESRQANALEQSANDVSTAKTGKSKKTQTEPKKNGKTKR